MCSVDTSFLWVDVACCQNHTCMRAVLLNLLTPCTMRPVLRSIGNTLHVPRPRLARDRAFSNIAPRLWNSLLTYLRQMHNITLFKQKLKRHLFHLLSKQISSIRPVPLNGLQECAPYKSCTIIIIIIIIKQTQTKKLKQGKYI